MRLAYALTTLASSAKACIVCFMIKPVQCEMARAAAGWSVRDLAREAKGNPSTAVRFETGQAEPIRLTLEAIQRALEAAGIEFTNGDAPGVRLRLQEAQAS